MSSQFSNSSSFCLLILFNIGILNFFNRNISITFDGWTSNKHASFIGITGHFLSQDGKLQSTLLNLIHTSDQAHTGRNVADIITAEVLVPYGIQNKTICAVTDNGSNMVLAVNNMGIRHMNCFAHTLQLVINGAIAACKKPTNTPVVIPIGKKSNPVRNQQIDNMSIFTEEETNEISKTLEEDEIPSHLSIYSMIAKCKKIVGHFHLSTKSMAILRAEMKNRNLSITDLIQEVPTRWNSTFFMLNRVYKLLDAIHIVKPKIKNADIPNLEAEEIEAFPEILAILEIFNEATEALSGSNYPSISLIIPAIKGIKKNINKISNATTLEISKEFLNHLKIKMKKLESFESRSYTQ